MRKWVLAAILTAATPVAAMAADAEAGKTVFNKCKACHNLEKNGVGPHLGGVVGRKAGSVEGFAYSEALKASGLTWDEATLDKWLAGPGKLVPGTKMVFKLGNADDRANVIEYLKTAK